LAFVFLRFHLLSRKSLENHCQLFHDFFLINLSNSFVNMTMVTRRLLSMRAGVLFLYNIHREFLIEFTAEQFSALIPAFTSHLLKEKWYAMSLTCISNPNSPFSSHRTCFRSRFSSYNHPIQANSRCEDDLDRELHRASGRISITKVLL